MITYLSMMSVPRPWVARSLSWTLWLLALSSGCGPEREAGEGETANSSDSGEGADTGDDSSEDPCTAIQVADDERCIRPGSFVDAADGPNVEHDLQPFLMDVTEVTVEQYAQCVGQGPCTPPETADGACNWNRPGTRTWAVNCVDWEQAHVYCEWKGKRLPTEWEWEWAARGQEEARWYPWGNSDPGSKACWQPSIFVQEPCEVGLFSPLGDSRDGLIDMAGNVSEWTESWLDESTMAARVARGGSWRNGEPDRLRADYRVGFSPLAHVNTNGFRCARHP